MKKATPNDFQHLFEEGTRFEKFEGMGKFRPVQTTQQKPPNQQSTQQTGTQKSGNTEKK